MVIEEFDLVYTNPKHLTIFREKVNKIFIYKQQHDFVSDSKQLNRTQSLVIPQAWNDVKISV